MRKNDKDRVIPTDYLTGNVDIAKSPLDYLMDKEKWEIIDMALCSLDPRTEKIVRSYYGFDGAPICPREIGKKLNLSGSRVQQLIYRAIRQFRHPAARTILEDCIGKEILEWRLGQKQALSLNRKTCALFARQNVNEGNDGVF